MTSGSFRSVSRSRDRRKSQSARLRVLASQSEASFGPLRNVFAQPRPEADRAIFYERVGKDRRGGRDSGYSPDRVSRSSRKRISPSLLVSAITKRTRPWLEVSA